MLLLETAIKSLEELVSTDDFSHADVCKCLDKIIEITQNEEPEIIAALSIDKPLRIILQQKKDTEIIEKISYLLCLITNVKELFYHLEDCLDDPETATPTLMLIFLLQTETEFYDENFNVKLVECINLRSISSEGFLFFILQVLEENLLEQKGDLCREIVDKLIEICFQIRCTKKLTKVLYVILVGLRMHPILFKKVEIRKLHILTATFKAVSGLVERIFIEAQNPVLRPKTVFLKNFIFPEFTNTHELK